MNFVEQLAAFRAEFPQVEVAEVYVTDLNGIPRGKLVPIDMLEKLGEGGVALGSDFDGALVPAEIGDVSGLPALVGAMRQAGYGEQLVARICRDNWLDVLRRTIG